MQWCCVICLIFTSVYITDILFLVVDNDTEQCKKIFASKEGCWISIASTHHTGMQLKGCYSSMSVRGLLLREERGKMYVLT